MTEQDKQAVIELARQGMRYTEIHRRYPHCNYRSIGYVCANAGIINTYRASGMIGKNAGRNTENVQRYDPPRSWNVDEDIRTAQEHSIGAMWIIPTATLYKKLLK